MSRNAICILASVLFLSAQPWAGARADEDDPAFKQIDAFIEDQGINKQGDWKATGGPPTSGRSRRTRDRSSSAS